MLFPYFVFSLLLSCLAQEGFICHSFSSMEIHGEVVVVPDNQAELFSSEESLSCSVQRKQVTTSKIEDSVSTAPTLVSSTQPDVLCPNRFLPFGVEANATKSRWLVGDAVEFSCIANRRLVGAKTSTCRRDGTWSIGVPSCVVKVCGAPEVVRNAPFSNTSLLPLYEFGDVVRVECNQWYEVVSGSETWRCSDDRRWVPTSPNATDDVEPVCGPACGVRGESSRTLGVSEIREQVAAPGEFPWMVFINFGFRENVAAVGLACNGVLISERYVLTAAHCLIASSRDYPPDGVRFPNHTHVWLGVHDRRQDRVEETNARLAPVGEVLVHPAYNRKPNDFDVALLRLDEEVVLDEFVRPICLPETNLEVDMLVPGRSSGLVVSWRDDPTRRLSYTLTFAELPSTDNDTCWADFQSVAAREGALLPPNLTLTENMFCVGFGSGEGGVSLDGSAGSPYILLHDDNGRYYVHGISSFGVPSMQSQTYSVFAKLNRQSLRWIRDNVV